MGSAKELPERPVFWSSVRAYESTQRFCWTFYNTVRPSNRLYIDGDGILNYVEPLGGPRRLLTLDDFFPVAHNLVDVRALGQNEKSVAATLRREEVALLFQADERHILPKLKAIVHEPVAVPRPDGRYEIVQDPGYDEKSGVYYWRRDGSPAIRLREGTEHLSRCFSGLPFLSPHHRSNVLAWLLGAVVLDSKLNPPMLVVTGNDRGVGKSSLVQACGIILTGCTQSPVAARGGEFMKQLSARFMEHGRFIPIDNVVTSRGQAFKNDGLARLLTEGYSKRVRILGHSRSVSQSGVLFALTANDCSLDTDLATRSLMVQLWKPRPGPMNPYCVDYAIDYRAELYGELLGLATSQPPSIAENLNPEFRFRAWLNFVHPRIRAAFGTEGDLALDDAEELDSRLQDLFAFGADNLNEEFTAPDLVRAVMDHQYRYEGLLEFLETARSDRGRAIKLGRFLGSQVGETYSPEPGIVYQLVSCGEDSRNKTKSFRFEEIQ